MTIVDADNTFGRCSNDCCCDVLLAISSLWDWSDCVDQSFSEEFSPTNDDNEAVDCAATADAAGSCKIILNSL